MKNELSLKWGLNFEGRRKTFVACVFLCFVVVSGTCFFYFLLIWGPFGEHFGDLGASILQSVLQCILFYVFFANLM